MKTVPDGWENLLLGEVCKFKGGSGFREELQGEKTGDYPFIKVSDMELPNNKKFITEANNWIIKKTRIAEGYNVFPSNSVVFAKVGAALLLNRRRILTRETCIDNNMMAAMPTNINFSFLFYVLSNIDFADFVQSGAVPSINQNQMTNIRFSFPSIPEQSKIAEILSTVDRAIEQTEALIAKQQRIKTGLMQDLLTRGIDEHGNIRSEDTHEFKDSPLGRIPVEWEVSRLSELANVERGKFTHRPRDDARFYGGPYPFIQTGDVTAHVGRVVNTYHQTLSQKGTSVSKEFPKGSIAITIAANIADTAILGQPMFFPDSVVGAVVCKPNSIRYVELTIRRWKPILESLAPQSAQRNINLEVLRPLLIAVPTPVEQDRIADVYEKVEAVLLKLNHTHNKLQSLKTALMQDLLTGNVRVTPLLEEETVSV